MIFMTNIRNIFQLWGFKVQNSQAQQYFFKVLMKKQQKYEKQQQLRDKSFQVVKQLQIYSKQDLENKGYIEGRFEISLSMSVIESELKEPLHSNNGESQNSINLLNSNKPIFQGQSMKSLGDVKEDEEIQNQTISGKVSSNTHWHPDQREFQVLLNKQQSNILFLQNQIKDMIKLHTMQSMVEEEKYLKHRISQLSHQVRKRKLQINHGGPRGVSPYQIKTRKNNKKINDLDELIKQQKAKNSRLGTKLALLQNYVKVSQRQQQHRNLQLNTNYYDQGIKEPIKPVSGPLTPKNRRTSRHFALSRSKQKLGRQRSEHKMKFSQNFISNQQENMRYNLLLQERLKSQKLLNEQCLRNYEQKIELLIKDRLLLKRQLEMIKFCVTKAEKEDRIFKNNERSIKKKGQSLKSLKVKNSPNRSIRKSGLLSPKKLQGHKKHLSLKGIDINSGFSSSNRMENSEAEESIQKTIIKTDKNKLFSPRRQDQSRRQIYEIHQQYFDRR